MAVQHAATACAHPCSASPNAMQFCVYWDVEPRYVDVTEDCLGAGARTAFAWTAHLAANSLQLGRTAVGWFWRTHGAPGSWHMQACWPAAHADLVLQCWTQRRCAATSTKTPSVRGRWWLVSEDPRRALPAGLLVSDCCSRLLPRSLLPLLSRAPNWPASEELNTATCGQLVCWPAPPPSAGLPRAQAWCA